jgi:hypothetical protein
MPPKMCGACWKIPDADVGMGKLIDPSGHKWDLCANCIKELWELKQPFNQDEQEDAEPKLCPCPNLAGDCDGIHVSDMELRIADRIIEAIREDIRKAYPSGAVDV